MDGWEDYPFIFGPDLYLPGAFAVSFREWIQMLFLTTFPSRPEQLGGSSQFHWEKTENTTVDDVDGSNIRLTFTSWSGEATSVYRCFFCTYIGGDRWISEKINSMTHPQKLEVFGSRSKTPQWNNQKGRRRVRRCVRATCASGGVCLLFAPVGQVDFSINLVLFRQLQD